MNWSQRRWPAQATAAERLFGWVAVLGGLSLVVARLLPGARYNNQLVAYLLLWVGGPCRLLFPLLASYLLHQPARRCQSDDWRRGLFNVGALLLLLAGLWQLLLIGFCLLLTLLSDPWEPHADGDSLFG
jgi:hypothetical protein